MVVSSCSFQRFRQRYVFPVDPAPPGPTGADIHVNESLLRIDSDPAIAKSGHLLGEFVHLGHRPPLDDDVSGVAEKVLTLFRAAHRPVVIGATVPAGDADRQTCEITQFLQRLHKAWIDFDPAAASAGEFVF